MATESHFDAAPSALGYLYQCRYALWLALQRDDDPNLCISIEKLDDVAFSAADGDASVSELLQFKHHINRRGGLSDKHPDIWKTLRIWSEAVSARTLDLDKVLLLLVTTSAASDRHAVRFIRPDAPQRNPEAARTVLEAAGQDSTSAVVNEGYRSLMRLPTASRKKFFAGMFLLDGSSDIVGVQSHLAHAVRHAARPEHRQAFVERLEGWWLTVVIRHLMDATDHRISVSDVQRQVHELRDQFRRDNLPDDFLIAKIPDEATPEDDERTFIRQLQLIRLSAERIRSAQSDHYKAFSQRSRWIRDNLLALEEAARFEERLVDEWKQRFDIMQESLPDACDEARLVGAGAALYNWTQTDAPGSAALLIRSEFRSPYMTRGSYHMLADVLRVGWHRHFREHLDNCRREDGQC